MRRDDLIRLRHMLEAAGEAMGFAEGRTRGDLDDDRLLVLALVKAIEILGEAAYQIPEETRNILPDIPWQDIIGIRHRLVHAYFDINLDILWQTIQEDLPPLVDTLERTLNESNSQI